MVGWILIKSHHSDFFFGSQLSLSLSLLPAACFKDLCHIWIIQDSLISWSWITPIQSLLPPKEFIHKLQRLGRLWRDSILPTTWIYHFCLSVHQFMGNWVISIRALWITLLWTFLYKCLCGFTFSALLGMYPGVELLGHMVALRLTFF